jgi:Methylase involved in ubiquinone/menaquinone biosynthesis
MNTDYYLKADLYDKYRWNYPKKAIDWILEKTKITNESVLCDVGAGTGKLTELFSPYSKMIYAVEPDDKMIEILRRKRLSNIITIQKSSDSVDEIENSIIDAIIVAHALHWFTYPSTLKEFNRILKKDGLLVNVSNIYKESNIVNNEIEIAIEKFKKPVNYQNKNSVVLDDYFSEFKEKEFEFSFENNFESYIGGISSASFYPDESDIKNYDEMKNIILKLFNEKCPDGIIKMNCGCIVQIGKLRKQ